MASESLRSSYISARPTEKEPDIPVIEDDETLVDVVRKLSNYLSQAIPEVSYTFEQLRSSPHGHDIRLLVHSLADNSRNPLIIAALMILKWQFENTGDTDWAVNESRGFACEYIAWQFLCHLTQDEEIEYLLWEIPSPQRRSASFSLDEREAAFRTGEQGTSHDIERTPLRRSSYISRFLGRKSDDVPSGEDAGDTEDPFYARLSLFFGLNALEIATIAQAKKFLSQKVVQKIIDNIWNGEIVFWDSLSVHSRKRPHFFNEKTADPYSRLRVPLYRKAFEAGFFVSFLCLYYAVLVERKPTGIGVFETLMYIWIAAFAYDELSGMTDAGVAFYQMDFWKIWNLGIIGTGLAFVIARVVGLAKESDGITDISFDILSLEALFLVPRICSLVSLNSYFGSLIPVLKEMTKAFFRFIPVVIVLYLGFLTTFTMLARDRLTLRQMSWILVKVFFGSNVLGFDIAHDISPIFGYGLMLIFVSMTNLLLISSLVSLMSMSLEGVLSHAREEYLFQLSIYVLESSNSRRLTYFMPPMNLIPLLCIRPLRLFLPAESIRRVRILLLRATHLPFVASIRAYEAIRRHRPIATPTTRRRSTSTRRYCYDHDPLIDRDEAPTALGPDPGRAFRTKTKAGGQPEARGPAPEQTGRDVVELTDVIDEVDQLRTQVDRVVALMAVRRRH
ncbi:uncharacterized protein EURHEDRAFT_410860 [Aspergillus ruber CBS 135680]|uniref:Calcium channel YVC1-like C-terminal transmembrane domain-containing protein n=1 Tax=Aspergillus ruber (strain CBS 135680) TaxID=1388766 RepID=A0A017SJ55_ASPRC|nr:uncharacterized protein EURHEDRAFT_410860 [Aspergillus ruber CBS 135680]EYE96345.1 hypothetical protein EURHEDRAFT_410860 [Aspergillus ruber CBS 135680]